MLNCRACGYHGIAAVELDFETPIASASATRCSECGSLELLDEILGSSPNDATVDDYIISGAGVGTIAALIADLPAISGGRLLDVGCGYGFALDLARWRHGWDVVGVEPSYAGVRGAEDLGLDIRNEPLTPQTDVGTGYDVIVSSEVLEHVTDPLALLQEMSRRLSDDGLLVLTTPDAAVVDRAAAPADIVSALSPGYHVFLASRAGLESLLERAGFDSWRITRTHVSHEVVARKGRGLLPHLAMDRSPVWLVDYLLARGRETEKPILRTGLLSRAVRELVAQGRMGDARGVLGRLRDAVRDAYGVRILGRRTSSRWPEGLAGCAFAVGMLELIDGDPNRAVRRFDEALDAIERRRQRIPALDLDTLEVEAQARFHRLLGLARIRPDAVVDGLSVLGEVTDSTEAGRFRRATWVARLFVELATRGAVAEARRMLASADDAVRELAASSADEALAARRDVLICRPAVAPPEAPPALDEAPVVAFTHYVDVLWGDLESSYVSGWLHLDGDPGTELSFLDRGRRIPAERTHRPDLASFWPDAASVADSGFRAFLPGPPPGALEVEWVGAAGRRTGTIELPAERRPELDVASDGWERIAPLFADAPPGPVLYLGARRTSRELPAGLDRFVGAREVIGLDIHPGIGVDIVADAHRLAAVVEPGRFPIVISASLLEHVAAPWLVAAQIATILPVGGVTAHAAPWAWPSHAEPNDFWRFSPAGLAALFSPELGFDAIDAGGSRPAILVPVGAMRAEHPLMPTTTSPTISWVCLVKRRETAEGFTWPYDEEKGRVVAERYPVEGIVSGITAVSAERP